MVEVEKSPADKPKAFKAEDETGIKYDNPSAPTAVKPEKYFHGWRASKGPQKSNLSGFRATGHRLLLATDVVEKTTASGIVLVEKTVDAEKNMAVVATVVEIGYDAWSDKSTDYCEVGDRVLVGQYAGKFHVSPLDGKEYRFINDLDIITSVTEAA